MSKHQIEEVAELEYYQCPGEKSKLTRVMCLARQEHNYEKCAECPHRMPKRPKPERIRRLRI